MRPIAVLGPLFSRLLLALALCLPLFGGGALAQQEKETQAQRQQAQPYNNAPVWRDVRSGKEEYTSVKGRETGVLIQTFGETWRQLRNGPITFYGGLLIVVAVLAIGLFYKWKGAIGLHDKPTGRLIERFSDFERIGHWTMAISFSVLGITGLIILFGKHLLLPVIGYTLFAWLTQLSKNLHNFVGPVFMLSVVIMIVIWARDNLPRAYDFSWFGKLGGMVSGEHVPSGRFNAGEKGYFWIGVVVLGIVMSATGLILDFPNFDQARALMIQADIVHSIAGVVFISVSFGHIYLGTIGVEGAYEGMRYGYVDEAWAKEHHEYWFQDVKSGKVKTGSAIGVPVAPQAQH